MLALVAVWGYSWVLSKLALRYCGPFEFATLRTAVAIVFLLPALLWQRKPLWPGHPEEVFLVGVIQTALFLLLNSWALSLGEAGKTSVLVFTMPFWVLVFAWPILGERIEGWGRLAVVLAALGLVLILEPWNLHATLLAKVLAVLAGICWALGVVISKHLHNRHPVEVFNFTFWQMALGLVPMLVVSLAAHSRPIQWTGEFVLLTLLLGIVGSALGWIAWFYVLRRLAAGTITASTPVIASLSAGPSNGMSQATPGASQSGWPTLAPPARSIRTAASMVPRSSVGRAGLTIRTMTFFTFRL